MKWIWWCCLSVMAVQDLKYRKISLEVLGLWLLPGCVNMVRSGDIAGHLSAAGVGVFMLLLSRATRGAIGMGDGLFFLLTACYLRLHETALLFLASLGISCIWGIFLLFRAWRTGDNGYSKSVPFLTCAWLPGLWIICCG